MSAPSTIGLVPLDWQSHLGAALDLLPGIDLAVAADRLVYPAPALVFEAFRLTSFADVRVVIVGQDPYHGAGQATGLAFSVPDVEDKPPSLCNILQELHDDVGCAIPASGGLSRWATNGVLLLNEALTVRANTAGSHLRVWRPFTNAVISALDAREDAIVFLLWGRQAQRKARFVTRPQHTVIRASHPSTRSAHRGFVGSRPFSKANAALYRRHRPVVDWCLE
jgi:uracil-DNA glycosylase